MTSAPDWVTLTESEEVVWSGHPSLIPYFMAAAGSILLIALGLAVLLFGEGIVDVGYGLPVVAGVDLGEAIPWGIVAAVIALIGVIGLLIELISWFSRVYVVTTEEVYRKHGIISRKVTNMNHGQIQNTTFTQSVLGRLLSYGDVKVDTAGGEGAEVVFKYVRNPESVVGKITRHLEDSATA